MKTVQLAVVLLIVCLSCGEALRCHRCVPGRVGGTCTTTVEECGQWEDVCIYVSIKYPTFSFFRRCSKRYEAEIMKSNPHLTVNICENDLCN